MDRWCISQNRPLPLLNDFRREGMTWKIGRSCTKSTRLSFMILVDNFRVGLGLSLWKDTQVVTWLTWNGGLSELNQSRRVRRKQWVVYTWSCNTLKGNNFLFGVNTVPRLTLTGRLQPTVWLDQEKLVPKSFEYRLNTEAYKATSLVLPQFIPSAIAANPQLEEFTHPQSWPTYWQANSSAKESTRTNMELLNPPPYAAH